MASGLSGGKEEEERGGEGREEEEVSGSARKDVWEAGVEDKAFSPTISSFPKISAAACEKPARFQVNCSPVCVGECLCAAL